MRLPGWICGQIIGSKRGFLPRHFSSTVICWIIPPSQIHDSRHVSSKQKLFSHTTWEDLWKTIWFWSQYDFFAGGGFLLEITVGGVLSAIAAIAMRDHQGVMNCYIQKFDSSALASFLWEGFPWLRFLWTLLWSSHSPLARSPCCQWCQELQRSVPEVCFFSAFGLGVGCENI